MSSTPVVDSDDERITTLHKMIEFFDMGPGKGYHCKFTIMKIIDDPSITAKKNNFCLEDMKKNSYGKCMCLSELWSMKHVSG